MTPTQFNGNWTLVAVPSQNQFTFAIPIEPSSPALNKYQVVASPRSVVVNSHHRQRGHYTVATNTDHGFHAGQTVTISGIKGADREHGRSAPKSFIIQAFANSPGNATTGNAPPSATAQTAASVVRNATTASAPATISGMPAKWFANGDEVITMVSGSAAGESGAGGAGSYVASKAKISCSLDCTTFTYTITTSPAESGTSYGVVTIPGAGASAGIAVGNITRSGATAKVVGVTPACSPPTAW